MQNLIYLSGGIVKLNVSSTGNFAYATTALNGETFKFRARRYQSTAFICSYGKYQVSGLAEETKTYREIINSCLDLMGL